MKTLISLMAGMLVLAGCAPIPVNLSGSEALVNRPAQKQMDYKFVIINRAEDVQRDYKMFGASTFPLSKNLVVKPQDTLVNDLKKYFTNVTDRADNHRRIVARIDKADAYWVNPGVNTVPLVGLFTAGTSNYPFVFDLSITFEVEENGKVVSSWPFTQKVEIPDGYSQSDKGMRDSYQRLIAKYRQTMFDAITDEFIPRYLSTSPISIPVVKN